jgi:hypothetical protein
MLQLANPGPGDLLGKGAIVVSDVATTSDRVEVLLDNRDAGGTFLGAVHPGQAPNFQLAINVPRGANGARDLFVGYEGRNDRARAHFCRRGQSDEHRSMWVCHPVR